MKNRTELERNEMSEILAQNFALNDQKFDASDFECSAHCLQMAGFHKTEWISVEERLPDKDGKYLAYYGRRGFIMLWYYHELEGVFGFEHWDVTHWMPLPEAPKGDEGK